MITPPTTTAPPTAIPAIAPVDNSGFEEVVPEPADEDEIAIAEEDEEPEGTPVLLLRTEPVEELDICPVLDDECTEPVELLLREVPVEELDD